MIVKEIEKGIVKELVKEKVKGIPFKCLLEQNNKKNVFSVEGKKLD